MVVLVVIIWVVSSSAIDDTISFVDKIWLVVSSAIDDIISHVEKVIKNHE